MKKKLREYQKEILKYTLRVQHPALFVDMRLGKTLVTIRRVKQYNASAVLVVCPYSAFQGWRSELLSEYEGLPYEIDQPGMIAFQELAGNFISNKWFLINKEGFLRVPEIKDFSWDVVILDESTFIKNPKSKVTQYFNKYFREVKHRWILTGLPDPESELDFFEQLRFLDYRILGIKNYWNFILKYFVMDAWGKAITEQGKTFLKNKLAKHCYFLSRSDVNIGPIKIYEQRIVKMPDDVRKGYNKLKKEFILEFKGNVKLTRYAVTKFQWMRQLCCGITYIDDTNKELIWPGKLDLLEELVTSELAKSQLIIWCNYIQDLLEVQKRFKKSFKIGLIYGKIPNHTRDKLVEQFQSGKIDWLVIQPICMRYGTNLSMASASIYYSTPLGLETRLQTEDRIIDAATTEPKLIIDLIAEKTIEERMIKGLSRKENRHTILKNLIRLMQWELANEN